MQDLETRGYIGIMMANTFFNVILMSVLYGLAFLLDVMRNDMANR